MNNESLLVIFVGLTGFALLVQAIVMLAAFLTLRKTVVSLQGDVHELREKAMPVLDKAMPIIEKSRETIDRLAPKIDAVSADITDVVHTLRDQTHQFQLVAGDVLERVHRQTSRVDNMFTGVVDGVEHAGNVMVDSVVRPVRQVNAVLAGAKAFLSVLATGRRNERVVVTTEEDMFV